MRGSAILDKILSNLPGFYHSPEVTSNLGKSDHHMVVAKPCKGIKWSAPQCNRVLTVSRKPTYQHKCDIGEALRSTYWTMLYHSQSCEEQFDTYFNRVTDILDTSCPLVTRTQYFNDKPWITDHFKALISQRQAARAPKHLTTLTTTSC